MARVRNSANRGCVGSGCTGHGALGGTIELQSIQPTEQAFFRGNIVAGAYGRRQGSGAMVPGSFELPLVAQNMAISGRYDTVICLGVVIRGATPHFELITGEVAKGISQAGMKSGVPVTFGVVTCDTIEQAIERSGSKVGNKGVEAALGAIEMANLLRQIDNV